MISSKNEYELFLRADSVANKFERMPMKWINIRFRYLRCLRRYEYVVNCKPTLFIVRKQLLRLILSQLSVKSGIQIPINTLVKLRTILYLKETKKRDATLGDIPL